MVPAGGVRHPQLTHSPRSGFRAVPQQSGEAVTLIFPRRWGCLRSEVPSPGGHLGGSKEESYPRLWGGMWVSLRPRCPVWGGSFENSLPRLHPWLGKSGPLGLGLRHRHLGEVEYLNSLHIYFFYYYYYYWIMSFSFKPAVLVLFFLYMPFLCVLKWKQFF